MRHVVYSDDKTETLAARVVDEIAKTDEGFSFQSAVGRSASDRESKTLQRE